MKKEYKKDGFQISNKRMRQFNTKQLVKMFTKKEKLRNSNHRLKIEGPLGEWG